MQIEAHSSNLDAAPEEWQNRCQSFWTQLLPAEIRAEILRFLCRSKLNELESVCESMRLFIGRNFNGKPPYEVLDYLRFFGIKDKVAHEFEKFNVLISHFGVHSVENHLFLIFKISGAGTKIFLLPSEAANSFMFFFCQKPKKRANVPIGR